MTPLRGPKSLDRPAFRGMILSAMKTVGANVTKSAKASEVERRWLVLDAAGKVLGRLAARVATILQGKHKPIYTPHVDCGDFVIVTNASEIRVTGKKLDQVEIKRYSGYLGGLKLIPLRKMLAEHPDRVIQLAVRRMLPKTRLGRAMLKKLKVYAGAEHPHAAQKPEKLEI